MKCCHPPAAWSLQPQPGVDTALSLGPRHCVMREGTQGTHPSWGTIDCYVQIERARIRLTLCPWNKVTVCLVSKLKLAQWVPLPVSVSSGSLAASYRRLPHRLLGQQLEALLRRIFLSDPKSRPMKKENTKVGRGAQSQISTHKPMTTILSHKPGACHLDRLYDQPGDKLLGTSVRNIWGNGDWKTHPKCG